MRIVFTCLLSLVSIAVISQRDLTTFYFPPFASATLDEYKWNYPCKKPLMLHMTARDEMSNRCMVWNKDNTVYVEIICSYFEEEEEKLTDYFEEDDYKLKASLTYRTGYHTFIHKEDSTLAFLHFVDKHHGIIIQSNCHYNKPDRVELLKEVLNSVQVIDPSIIDNYVGYPVPKTASIDSLRRNRLENFQRSGYRKLGDGNFDKNFERKYMKDVKNGFSFKAFHNELIKDYTQTFTRQECLSFWFSPDSLKAGRLIKLDKRTPMLKNSVGEQYSATGMLNTSLKWKEYKIDNKDGKGFEALQNDSVFDIVYAEKWGEKWTATDHIGKLNPKSNGKVTYDGDPEVVAFEMAYSSREKEYIVVYAGQTGKMAEYIYETPESVYILDTNEGDQPMMEFQLPSNWKQYRCFIQCRNATDVRIDHTQYQRFPPVWNLQSADSSTFKMKALTSKAQREKQVAIVDDGSSWTRDQYLFISPVYYTDLDEDNKKEVWRIFISNGRIVFTEVYEQGVKGYAIVRQDEAWRERLVKYSPVLDLIALSTTYEMSGFAAPVVVEEKIEDPVIFAEEMALYPGGDVEMHMDINSNLMYPKEMVESNVQGTVFISMVIEKDGSVTNVQVQRSVHPALDEAAVKAVKMLPKKFDPGRQNGRIVRMRITIPVKFKL